MSQNPSSTTLSTSVNNQFESQKGSSGYLGLDLSNNSLKILDEIQHLYEERMKTLDTEAAGDADRLRVLTLQSWVKDLGEQNGLLVRTVEELEREMTQRVLLLEEKFHVTSHETHKFMTRAEDLNNKLQEARSGSRDFASYTDNSNLTVQDYGQQSNLLLETEVSHLKNDRENLCKLIQKGLETGNWSTKRFQFYEINDDDIFGPTINYSNSSARHVAGNLKDSKDGEDYRQAELLTLRQNQEAMERELVDRDRIIKDNLLTMKSHIEIKDEQIRDLKLNLQAVRDETRCKSSASVAVMTDAVVCLSETERQAAETVRLGQSKDIAVLSGRLQDMELRLEFAVREKERVGDQLGSVHRELHFKAQEAAALTRVIAEMDKASKDKQAALSAEVADKHDQISAQRGRCQQLEDECRQAAKQTTFKDGIIKEMRKEIKNNRAKILELEQNIQKKLSDPDRSTLNQPHLLEKKMYCVDQSRPSYAASKFPLAYPSDGCSGDRPRERPQSPPSKDMAVPGAGGDRSQDLLQTASSVTFTATRTDTRSDCHDQFMCGDESELEDVQHVNQEAMHNNEMLCHGDLLSIIQGNLTDMRNKLYGFQQQYMEGAQLAKHVHGEIIERMHQLQTALTLVQETVNSSLRIINMCLQSRSDVIQPNVRVDIETFFAEAKRGNSVFDNMKTEIDNLVYTLSIREKQSRDLVSVIGSLQNSLHLTQKQLQTVDEMFLKERGSTEQRRLTNKCDIDDYRTKFNLEQAASDEMKAEMNRLIATLHLRDKQIIDQGKMIDELQLALKLYGSDLGDMQEQARNSFDNKNKSNSQLVLKLNEKTVDQSGDSVKVVKRVRGVCFADAEIAEKQKDIPDDDYRAFKDAESQLKDVSLQLDAREQHIRRQDEIIDTLQTHVKQVESELKELQKTSSMKCKSASEHSENQKRVADLLGSASDLSAEGYRSGSAIDREMRPAPRILRAASIEEFRVKTVEAQAALEDMMEETEALVKNLNLREDKLNSLESVISLLEQTLTSNKKEMLSFKEKMDQHKQISDLYLLERERQIKLIKEDVNTLHDMNKSFEKLTSSKRKFDVAEYHTAAKVYQQTIDQITDKLLSSMHFVISQEEQIVEKENSFQNIQQHLDQIQNGMRDLRHKVTEYLQVKEVSDKSREESERKLEKWQCELEYAQDELRRNVEHYQSGNYVSREASASVMQPRRVESSCRSSNARNYVYDGKDLDVRRAIERMKEQIDSLSDELEEQDQHNMECDRKVAKLKEQLSYTQSQVESPQQKLNNDILVTSLREQQCIIDEYCRKSKELEEELARTRRDLYAAQHSLREKDELLHNSSKRSKDEENMEQEQSERLLIMEEALNGREQEILQLLLENRELLERIQMKDGDIRQLSVSIEKQRNKQQNCGCQVKEKRIRMLVTENRKMFRKNLGKDDRLRHMVGENSKLQRKIRQLREKILKVFTEQQKAVETVAESNTRLETQLQDAWRQIQAVDEEKQLEGKEILLQLDAEEQCNEENVSRIEEMQRLLDSKTEEIKVWKLAVSNLQQKHEVLLRHITHQEKEIQDLKIKLSCEFEPKIDAEGREQLLGVLQIDLESCQNANIEIQNELLRLQHANQSFVTQASSLLATVKDLKHKLDLSERNYAATESALDAKQADLVHAVCKEAALQEDLVHAACKEAALQEEFTSREHHLLQRLGDAQADELKLSDAVQETNGEVDRLTAELNDKGRTLRDTTVELHNVTQHANQLTSDLEMLDQANKRLLSAQQRLESLENKSPDMEMLSSVWQKVNQKQREHISVLKDRLQDADKRNASAQEQLHFSMQNQSVLEENYRLLESRNNTLKSELSSLENEYQSFRADTDKAQNNDMMKVASTHSSSSRETQSGDRMRYLCDAIIKKETQIRRLYNENSSLLKTIQQLFAQNTLMRKKLQFYKETLRSDSDTNQWPQLNHIDPTLANVVVVTESESYSTNINNRALYPEHNYNVSTSSHLPSHPVICHTYQSTTLANDHLPCSPRASQFSRYTSEGLASHAR